MSCVVSPRAGVSAHMENCTLVNDEEWTELFPGRVRCSADIDGNDNACNSPASVELTASLRGSGWVRLRRWSFCVPCAHKRSGLPYLRVGRWKWLA